ncbi:hypothetical protein DL768_006593 [Monosporascus sp. mg162]|nr:hypothetical protein DL768_006593 [Monosporascus sp. mg162]
MPALSRIDHVYGASQSMSGAGIGDHGGTELGEWSSLIGIVTAIVGNVLIALALNVQRYAHIQLHRRRVEARERARAALKRVQDGSRASYGATERPSPDAQEDDHEDGAAQETNPLVQSFHSSNSAWTENADGGPRVVSSYLKSPAWWLGQVLMTVGEMGNFLAYGFAPASIVSPLGVFALISNCVIAPLFFGERFRKRDFWGVVIAVAGAVTVVLSANHEENKLDPHDVWDAITTMEFEIYVVITTVLILVLMWASPKYGHRTILIDLGLVGLFGGYTVLTTKGVSSMLSSTLLKAFATPVTYGLLFVLIVTAVMQVRYVNKALQRFDSTQVIPIQFVLFTLSVIMGSAVLYRDFERTTETQAAKFVGGCLLTFFGVFLITSGRPPQNEEDQLSDDENVEETIGLRPREAADVPSQPTGASRHEDEQHRSVASSRRSSLGSHLSFAHAISKSLASSLNSRATMSRSSLPTSAEEAPLLTNPWRSSTDDLPTHPGLPPTLSTDSVFTCRSMRSVAVTELSQPSNGSTTPAPEALTPERPTTPPRHSPADSRPLTRHYNNTFISPSPLSSTVSAVVSDALGRRDGSSPRRLSTRRGKPRLIQSIDLPHDERGPDSVADPLFRSRSDRTTPLGHGEDQPAEHKSLRRRAHSLGNTLEGFFGRKRRRRNTLTEGQSTENRAGDGPSGV